MKSRSWKTVMFRPASTPGPVGEACAAMPLIAVPPASATLVPASSAASRLRPRWWPGRALRIAVLQSSPSSARSPERDQGAIAAGGALETLGPTLPGFAGEVDPVSRGTGAEREPLELGMTYPRRCDM